MKTALLLLLPILSFITVDSFYRGSIGLSDKFKGNFVTGYSASIADLQGFKTLSCDGDGVCVDENGTQRASVQWGEPYKVQIRGQEYWVVSGTTTSIKMNL